MLSARCKSLWIVLLATQLSGCYYLQAAQGQVALLARRQPISTLVTAVTTEPTLRTRLEYVQAAREFAVAELGLPNHGSYTSYADIKRPYVTWNVFAAPEFSVSPKQWCFPIAGCVVYRGYFSEAAAERYALHLRLHGYDATVSGVPAYSTLGHFNDPILSSMLRWSDAQLAATIFHELAHQVVYVPGDSAFNEAFATVVEEVGLTRWLQARQRDADLQRWRVQQQRADQFYALLLQARQDLQHLYASQLSAADMEVRKQQRLGLLKFQYTQLKSQWQGYGGYDAWFDRRLGNADFVAIATYQQCVPAFERLLASVEGDLPRFYNEVKKTAHLESRVRRAMCDQPRDRN